MPPILEIKLDSHIRHYQDSVKEPLPLINDALSPMVIIKTDVLKSRKILSVFVLIGLLMDSRERNCNFYNLKH